MYLSSINEHLDPLVWHSYSHVAFSGFYSYSRRENLNMYLHDAIVKPSPDGWTHPEGFAFWDSCDAQVAQMTIDILGQTANYGCICDATLRNPVRVVMYLTDDLWLNKHCVSLQSQALKVYAFVVWNFKVTHVWLAGVQHRKSRYRWTATIHVM